MFRSRFDGANNPPHYEIPAYTGPKLSPDKDQKLYTGSCHCGAITIAVKAKPLGEAEVREHDCSICNVVRAHILIKNRHS